MLLVSFDYKYMPGNCTNMFRQLNTRQSQTENYVAQIWNISIFYFKFLSSLQNDQHIAVLHIIIIIGMIIRIFIV